VPRIKPNPLQNMFDRRRITIASLYWCPTGYAWLEVMAKGCLLSTLSN
jgi:hypothetical protein